MKEAILKRRNREKSGNLHQKTYFELPSRFECTEVLDDSRLTFLFGAFLLAPPAGIGSVQTRWEAATPPTSTPFHTYVSTLELLIAF